MMTNKVPNRSKFRWWCGGEVIIKLIIVYSALLVTQHSVQADVRVYKNDTIKKHHMVRILKAARFLSQASMGATQNEILSLANQIARKGENKAFNDWLTQQFSKKVTKLSQYTEDVLKKDGIEITQSSSFKGKPTYSSTTNRRFTQSASHYQKMMWWDRAIRGNDQLRQRTAWALSQIFVTSGKVDSGLAYGRWRKPLYYYDNLLVNAFGNYRKLIEDVTYDPFMGVYLSHLRNTKGNPENGVFPDENYAREVMQLFSIGVYNLRQDGQPFYRNGKPVENYDNDTVKTLARVFTGLTLNGAPESRRGFFYGGTSIGKKMVMDNKHHDQEAKSYKLAWGNSTKTFNLTKKQGGDQDITDVLDSLSNHPSLPPYMARLLIQRFTSSNPSPKYIFDINKVWKDNGKGTRGDLKAVIRAILMHQEARNAVRYKFVNHSDGSTLIKVESNDDISGKIKEPVLMLAQIMRYYGIKSYEADGVLKLWKLERITKQPVLNAPSVFNYYSPDYEPSTGPLSQVKLTYNSGKPIPVVSPESELTPLFNIDFFNEIKRRIISANMFQNIFKGMREAELTRISKYKKSPDQYPLSLVIDEANIYLCNGTVPEKVQDEMARLMQRYGSYKVRLGNILASILTSGDFAVVH
ncbi:MAG: DUF1800 domain-containing protein [Lentisphaeraceae bacterium]|nr:DUF1800 domain-containing protein [Lentisphaeraceae bacterium]